MKIKFREKEVLNNRLKSFFIYLGPLVVIIVIFIWYMDQSSPSNPEPAELNLDDLSNMAQDTNSDVNVINAEDVDELNIEDITEGSGDEVKSGDTVKVHYIGTLLDGTKFDSSYEREEAFEFTIGAGSVIEGWEQGLVGMKVGGKRKLTIPSSMGYGETGSGSIPSNAKLVFEIELIEIL